MGTKKTAMVSGHICLDITPVINPSVVKPLNEVLIPGTLVTVSGVDLSMGGAVWNVGMALTKLGIPTNFNGMVGMDEFGDIIVNMLDKNKVECGLTRKKGALTSFSIVVSVAGSDRIFLHAPGANNDFTAADVNYDQVQKADLFHFGYPPVMRGIFVNGGHELVEIFRKAKATGVTTSLDMAMPDPLSESGAVDWDGILRKVLPFVDIYAPSIEETLYMVDRPAYDRLKIEAGANDMISVLDTGILAAIAGKLHSYGAKLVLLKCGYKGCFVSTGTIDGAFGRACPKDTVNWSGRKILEKCFTVDRVVSTTGAGDTTIAGFLASLLEDTTIEQAMANATATGAVCVGTHDAVSGIISLSEIEKKIDTGWKKSS